VIAFRHEPRTIALPDHSSAVRIRCHLTTTSDVVEVDHVELATATPAHILEDETKTPTRILTATVDTSTKRPIRGELLGDASNHRGSRRAALPHATAVGALVHDCLEPTIEGILGVRGLNRHAQGDNQEGRSDHFNSTPRSSCRPTYTFSGAPRGAPRAFS